MKYSQKLKKAMEEIKDVLNRHDIAAAVVIHEPGFSEYLFRIDPSYSCAQIDATGQLRVKNTDRPAYERRKMSEDTLNMFNHLETVSSRLSEWSGKAQIVFKKKFKIEHYGPGYSSRNEQEN